MLPLSAHAGADDVDVGQHPDPRAINDLGPEVGEITPTGGAGVDDGGDTGREGVDVRVERQGGAAVGGEDVGVHVDDARHDVVARHIEDGFSICEW